MTSAQPLQPQDLVQADNKAQKSGRDTPREGYLPSLSFAGSTAHLLFLSLIIQFGLLLYANHVDSHPERYGGLKYTDVDWRVVSDGAKLIFHPDESQGNLARGWAVRRFGLNIGDPYERATFRYTPLLALFVAPSLLHPLLGRILLVVISLMVPPLLLFTNKAGSRAITHRPSPKAVHILWTLNPFVMNITTRGSPESIICLIVILVLVSFLRQKENQAAFWLGVAVSWKIYPAIYVPALWSALSRRHGWWGWGVWRFGAVAAITVVFINGALWLIWGQPFLEHTFLYHLTRLDHRHNFSPYFYPIYLSLYQSNPSSTTHPNINSSFGSVAQFWTSVWPGLSTNSTLHLDMDRMVSTVLRHPLTSFLPQLTLVLLAGFGLQPITGIEFAMFVQTAVFVVFNKVCTSQYFMWFLPLIPSILPSISPSLTFSKSTTLLGAWIGAQALWLFVGYQLEFMAREVYLVFWAAGVGLFGVSIWVWGELIESFTLPTSLSASVSS